MDAAVAWIDGIARETMLFAAVGFLIGGLDDLAVDAAYLVRATRRRWRGSTVPVMADFPVATCTGRIAVLVPAWDEAAVIGAMLRATLARFDHPDWRLYAGAYPNDRATIDAIAAVAAEDGRVRPVLTPRPGPTTKADCLNALWRAVLADGAAEDRGFTAIVLHDAEDVVHPGELRLYDHMLRHADAVQIPVLPLPDPASRWVSGHYIDEFAESHGRQLPVRHALGAGLPFAGVGCAISTAMLARIAEARGGVPFDEASLTEDYELSIHLDKPAYLEMTVIYGNESNVVRSKYLSDSLLDIILPCARHNGLVREAIVGRNNPLELLVRLVGGRLARDGVAAS